MTSITTSDDSQSSLFTTLLKRLEVATVRLEGVVQQQSSAVGSTSVSSSQASTTAMLPFVHAHLDLIQQVVVPYQEKSIKIGGVVADQAELVIKAFNAVQEVLVLASQFHRPKEDKERLALSAPIQALIQLCTTLRDSNRASPLFNLLSAVSEGLPALAWVAVEPTPGPFVSEMKEAAQFYANRILKDKHPNQVEWAKSYMDIWTHLITYIKEYHTTGLSWNSKGSPFASQQASSQGGLPPPPPPPPPASSMIPSPKSATAAAPDMSQIFDQLNKGEGITSGLKKVDKSQMTHKNPELRASGGVVEQPQKQASLSSSSSSLKTVSGKKSPPRFELEGNKWMIENFDNKHDLVLESPDLRQVVYIYGCNQCTIQIKGKVNAITMDNCIKTGLVVNQVVSSIEFVQVKSVQLQILGSAPTIMLDKTDGCQMYLSAACIRDHVQILTSKCSELNVLSKMTEAEDEDFIERPIPEQFRTTLGPQGELITTMVTHSSV